MEMGGQLSSFWSWGWLLYSERDEGTEVLGSARAALPQSDDNNVNITMGKHKQETGSNRAESACFII